MTCWKIRWTEGWRPVAGVKVRLTALTQRKYMITNVKIRNYVIKRFDGRKVANRRLEEVFDAFGDNSRHSFAGAYKMALTIKLKPSGIIDKIKIHRVLPESAAEGSVSAKRRCTMVKDSHEVLFSARFLS